MIRFAIPVIVLAGLVAVFWAGLGRNPGYVPSPLVGKTAPDFELPQLLKPGATISTRDWRGEVVLLNVWATWCVGCRQEHDTLLQIAASGVAPIYGLNWKDDSDAAKRWLAQLGDPYRATAVDADGRVAIDWGVYGAPETFLIGPDGTVLYKHIAPLTMEIWRQEFLPRIAGARQAG